MKTAVEIYKLLPKTNCGTCGTATCFGFAAKVASGLASITSCANLNDQAREELMAGEGNRKNSPGTVYEQALEILRPRLASLDFQKLAQQSGAVSSAPDTLELLFLNDRFTVTKERIADQQGKEPRPFISILIYNHLTMPDPPRPAGEWITFSSVPASHAKDKAWAGHVEQEIASHFSGNVNGLKKACERLGGTPASIKGSHDAAYEFRFFPHYPVLLLFYDAVPDEDFPAQCKLLLDKHVDRFLDIESIVVLGEEFAGRLTTQ
ncbi:MAG: DUF3786 domain-containing protein [Nitrospirota bacterium]|nr:DUF3786 domain-containing protein [Nitrospirota bacterium]